MRWESGRESRNVLDLRGRGVRGGAGLGCGGLLLVIVIAYLTGANPLQLLGVIEEAGGGAPASDVPADSSPPADRLGRFASVVLADTEDTWTAQFERTGRSYQPPTLVLFDGAVRSACGLGSAAVGPFYCPADGRVYLDLSFFDELARRFGAPGDFAQAYVIAHEVGHHVQNLLGLSDRVRREQERTRSQDDANALSVRLELQADCLAGVWANHENESLKRQGKPPFIEPGDVEAALRTAAAIGDDTLQKRSQGYVVPDSFTHGSAEQRQRWFSAGFRSGTVASCNTFAAAQM
jgi:hypothetical protein